MSPGALQWMPKNTVTLAGSEFDHAPVLRFASWWRPTATWKRFEHEETLGIEFRNPVLVQTRRKLAHLQHAGVRIELARQQDRQPVLMPHAM
jgi:hypothetical protein